MKIGIDARFYNLHGGLGRYVSELISELIKINTDHELYLFLPVGVTIETTNPRIHQIQTSIPWYSWREQFVWPRVLSKYQLDLMHFPHFNVPLLYFRPFVVTIHDLILLTQPAKGATYLHPWLFQIKKLGYRLVIRRALKSAQHIITTSKFTSNDIQRYFSIPAKKITVTYQASRWPRQLPNLVRKKQLLYVGNCYPHKQVEFLLDAFSIFRGRHSDYTFVIAGHEDRFFRRVKTMAQQYHDCPIGFRADISDQELAELYQTSELYLFPSLYEGFGLPGLEAMACGLPVLASDSSCLPEIYGTAAQYFQAGNQTDFLSQLERLSSDPDLRQQMQGAGLERVQQFSWQQLAVDTLAIYEKTRT
jgi:glycosyltransferase involved in cell wall biosynthesis